MEKTGGGYSGRREVTGSSHLSQGNILVCEDETDVAEVVRLCLEDAGYNVRHAPDGPTALHLVRQLVFDLLILDIMLPRQDGLSVLRELRSSSRMPVLVLSARSDVVDRVVGLELGADDYLPKPFDARELLARVRALIRRSVTGAASECVVHGPLRIDLLAHTVELGGRQVELTPLEYSLLAVLATHRGKAMSRQELLDAVWGRNFFGSERTIDTHVGNLRKKFKQLDPEFEALASVRSVGYRFG